LLAIGVLQVPMRWIAGLSRSGCPISPLGRFVLVIVGAFLAVGKVARHIVVVEKGRRGEGCNRRGGLQYFRKMYVKLVLNVLRLC